MPADILAGSTDMHFKHTDRNGFWIGIIDFISFGLFFIWYMENGVQEEIDEILGRKTRRYYLVYLMSIPTLFIYAYVWMAKIAEELKEKAISLGIEGKLTSFRHMLLWNTIGILFFGPAISTKRFFDTLNQIERKLNEMHLNEEQNKDPVT